VYDVAGGLVRRLFDGDAAAGATGVTWDGRDDRGARLSGGIYYARLATTERTSALKIVRLGG
jgi:flagellar hook assembly protein FlgD